MTSVHDADDIIICHHQGQPVHEQISELEISTDRENMSMDQRINVISQDATNTTKNLLRIIILILLIIVLLLGIKVVQIMNEKNTALNQQEDSNKNKINAYKPPNNKEETNANNQPSSTVQQIVPPPPSFKPSPPSTPNKNEVPRVQGIHNPDRNHRHSGKTFSFSVLGIPEPGKTYDQSRVTSDKLRQFDDEINKLFKPYNDTDCDFVRYGQKNTDGGYVVCKNFFASSQAMINIGISGTDNFGCQVTSAFPMANYQYDCTNPRQPKCTTNNNNNHFYLACVGPETEKGDRFEFHTLQHMISSHNLDKKRITLKIDCQGGQFPGLKYFPLEKLDYIDQIIGEFHLGVANNPEEWGNLEIFRSIMKKFVPVNYHINNWSCFLQKQNRALAGGAIQFTLVNKNIIKLKSESRSYAQHPLNTPNRPGYADCQPKD